MITCWRDFSRTLGHRLKLKKVCPKVFMRKESSTRVKMVEKQAHTFPKKKKKCLSMSCRDFFVLLIGNDTLNEFQGSKQTLQG